MIEVDYEMDAFGMETEPNKLLLPKENDKVKSDKDV